MAHTSIALLRGINVGGKNVLPMKELARILESLGLEDVRTYIQSGNVVFRTARKPAKALAATISAAIEERHGFAPRVLVLGRDELDAAMAANPFPAATAAPKSLHLSFLESVPRRPDTDAIEELCSSTEEWSLEGRVFYLHAPEGIGRSKLAARVESLLGVPATARNWRTVEKLAELAALADG